MILVASNLPEPSAVASQLFPKATDSLIMTQRLQYPLIREYSLNHIRDPTIT